MKKILIGITIFFTLFLTGFTKVDAATATISTRASRSTVTVGYSVTVTVTVSSSAPLGSWEYVLNYDSSKLKMTSSTPTYVVDVAPNSTTKSKSYSYTFRALKAGSTSVYITGASVIGWDENLMTTSTSKTYLTLANPVIIVLSDNNNLKNITTSEGILEPAFDKTKTDYTINVNKLIDDITITPTKEHDKATITGGGDLKVSEGANLFPIKVVAENGDEKTYNVTVNVVDTEPINVTLNGINYTVLKRSGTLDIPDNYVETIIPINSIEVAAYESELNNLLLVGLKDETGVSNLYVYDSNKETYKLYNEHNSNNTTLYLYEPQEEMPLGYRETKLMLNDVEIDSYKLKGSTNYYLVYGMNVETGNEGFYVYDSDENTFQRFNNDQVLSLNEKLDTYMMIIIAAGGVILLLIIISIVQIVKVSKIKKKIKKAKERKAQKIKKEIKKEANE